jgi:prepilin peptidase CpaA
MTLSVHKLLLLLVFTGALGAAVFDLRRGEIPDRLIFGMTLIGLGLRALSATPLGLVGLRESCVTSMFGVLVCGSIPLALYLMKSLGAGDLKLLCAAGACLGPLIAFELQLFAYGFGLVYALGRVIYEGTLWQTLSEVRWVARRTPGHAMSAAPALSTMRFGPAVAIAAFAVLLSYWGRS